MKSWKKVVTVSLGKAVEYYDLAIYIAISSYVATNFFPESAFGGNSMIMVWMLFGLRYIARPFGGFFMGSYADKYGRKSALVLIGLLTGTATLIMACLPTYEQIGLLAPCLFFLMQLLQTFSYAGESATAVVYLFESSEDNEHARTGALIWAAPLISVICSFLIVLGIKSFLTEAQMHDFGWRIPLLLGLLNIGLSYYFKTRLIDSASFKPAKKLGVQGFAALKIFLMTIPASILFHSSVVSSSILIKKFTSDDFLLSCLPVTFSAILFVATLGVGYLIDKYFDCKKILTNTYATMIVLGVPVYSLQEDGTWSGLLMSQSMITLFFAVSFSASASVIFNLTNHKNRIATIALGTNLGVLALGAFSPLLVSVLSSLGQAYVGLMLSFGGLCFFVALALDKYTQNQPQRIQTA